MEGDRYCYTVDDMKEATTFLKSIGINNWSDFTSSAIILKLANKKHREHFPNEYNKRFLNDG